MALAILLPRSEGDPVGQAEALGAEAERDDARRLAQHGRVVALERRRELRQRHVALVPARPVEREAQGAVVGGTVSRGRVVRLNVHEWTRRRRTARAAGRSDLARLQAAEVGKQRRNSHHLPAVRTDAVCGAERRRARMRVELRGRHGRETHATAVGAEHAPKVVERRARRARRFVLEDKVELARECVDGRGNMPSFEPARDAGAVAVPALRHRANLRSRGVNREHAV